MTVSTHLPSRLETLPVRGLRYAVRRWGAADAPRLFLLHGWMDSSPTFQFVVDALAADWQVIAPDWRGYGASEWLGRPYWFPDYYADLEALLRHYSAEAPVRLVGHSMGANIAATYAAARPQRVAQLVMLDFLGLRASTADDAPAQLARWLDAQRETPALRGYPDHAALARRLQAVNPRLTAPRAAFLAEHGSRRRPDGCIELACDPWHKVAAPIRYHLDDNLACWRAIDCPTLLLVAADGFVRQRFGDDPAERTRRLACFRRLDSHTLEDTGHNLQHDRPEAVAAALEAFLARC